MKLLATVMMVVVLGACDPVTPPGPIAPPPPPARFGLEQQCNQTLPGSVVLADIDASGVPIVCEQRLGGAPNDSYGWFDGTTIHIWAVPVNNPLAYVRKVAAHEYGHWIAKKHKAWVVGWTDENFAEGWAWCNYPHEAGVGYGFTGGVPSAAQCGQMRQWYANR